MLAAAALVALAAGLLDGRGGRRQCGRAAALRPGLRVGRGRGGRAGAVGAERAVAAVRPRRCRSAGPSSRSTPEDGQTRIGFSSDRDGAHALTVYLRPSCDLTGATEVPSERPEMRRYERVTRISNGYGGERHYTFTGGCVTYRFDLQGDTRAEPVAAISESLGFLSRASLARQVHDSSDGRLELDRRRGSP